MKIDLQESLISVEGIQVHAFHGVYANERREGNTYIVDLYLSTDLTKAAMTDELEDTLDYYTAYKTVLEIMAEPVSLLEHLTYKIGKALLEAHPSLTKAKVRVSKVNPLAMEACIQTYVELSVLR
ncbi:MAG: dihydroneopterin aldolase [Bacteroidota bacterium]